VRRLRLDGETPALVTVASHRCGAALRAASRRAGATAEDVDQYLREEQRRQEGCIDRPNAGTSHDMSPTLVAKLRHGLQRAHVHLAAQEQTGDADALPDVIRQLQPVRHIGHVDRRRSPSQESRLPAPRLRHILTDRVLQPEPVVVVLEAPRDRHDPGLRHAGVRRRLGHGRFR